MDQPTGVGAVGCSRSGVARGQRALLEADDAVGDVHSVGVDRRHADRCEVVREVSSRVELAVLGAVAAAFLVPIGPPSRVSVNLVPLLLTGVRLHPPGRTDKNLCRCFGAPVRRVFPDHLIISKYLRTVGLLSLQSTASKVVRGWLKRHGA